MKSLLLRIFVWSWLLVAAIVLVLVLWSPLLTRTRPQVRNWEQRAEEIGTWVINRIAGQVEELGIAEAERRRYGAPPNMPRGLLGEVWVVGPDDRLLAGQDLPPEALELAARARTEPDVVHARHGSRYLVARPVATKEAGPAVVVYRNRVRPRTRELLDSKTLVPQLLILLTIAAGFCFWLARSLSAPLRSLRGTTRSIAAGDFASRIPPRFTSRRDEIGQLAREFNTMAERVETLVGAQRRLVRDISHELRTPLARLGVALELARQKSDASVAAEYDRIELECNRLEAMLSRLLALSRLEAGVHALPRDPVDLGELVEAVVADARYEAAARGCTIVSDLDDGCVVPGVPDLLRSAVENVLRNAVQHTAQGTTISVQLRRGSPAGADEAILTFRDRGPGVPEHQLAEIFKPFFRLDEARECGDGGAGLGLAIAERAVLAHRGTIAAANAPDGGLVVEIRLPVGEPAPDPALAGRSANPLPK